MSSWNYKQAGVDVNAGYEAVRLMKNHAEATYIPGVLAGLGGFGGCFEMPAGYEQPVLVSGTDSVGTKLKIAFMTGIHNTVGIDCVAMCVNDIICQGAKPLFFLDYIGIGKLVPEMAAGIVEGVSKGCLQAGCALVGGETAELPGFYAAGEYDLAGFAVGVVEKASLITGSAVKKGDVLIGVASSGVHSNGFSLIRRLAFEVEKHSPDDYLAELDATLGEVLLTPTKIYAAMMDKLAGQVNIHGAAHITGGGWIENIPRLLGGNDTLKTVLHTKDIPVPKIFELLRAWGGLEPRDMYNTFNMGIGLVLAVDASDADKALKTISESGETAYMIGHVAERAGEGPILLVP